MGSPEEVNAQPGTRERLLAAAEEVFAEHGYAGATMRQLTERAGVNLAAANYHFRSKQGLLQAVLERHVRPLVQRRLTRLEAAVATDATVETILDAFIGPDIELISDLGERGPIVGRLLGRLHLEPFEVVGHMLQAEFSPMADRFEAALRRVLPDVPPKQLRWRLHCVVGVVTYTLSETGVAGMLDESPRAVTRRLVDFLAPGMKCPVTRKSR